MNPEEGIDITCPYCGERISLTVDCSAGAQEYVEDCQVCCQPISIRVRIDRRNRPMIDARRDGD